jgi:hypothetical protein
MHDTTVVSSGGGAAKRSQKNAPAPSPKLIWRGLMRSPATRELLLGCGGLLLALPALARESEPYLSVSRAEGAESCPSTASLLQRVEQLRGPTEAGATTTYQVTFSRDELGFRADIRSGAGGARMLRDRGRTCAALEQATAVTLALLLDAGAAAEPPPPPAPEELPLPKPVPSGSPELERRLESPAESGASLMLSLGAAGLVGVVRPAAPALAAELGIGAARFRTNIGALWMLPQSLQLGPGRVEEELFSGVARTCLSAALSGALRLDLCSGLYVGVLTARASGYTRNQRAQKTWLALPVELAFASLKAPLGFELSLSALVPLRRHDFVVDGVGVTYESLPVGALFSARTVGIWAL